MFLTTFATGPIVLTPEKIAAGRHVPRTFIPRPFLTTKQSSAQDVLTRNSFVGGGNLLCTLLDLPVHVSCGVFCVCDANPSLPCLFLVFRRPFAIFRLPYEKSTREEKRQKEEEKGKISVVSEKTMVSVLPRRTRHFALCLPSTKNRTEFVPFHSRHDALCIWSGNSKCHLFHCTKGNLCSVLGNQTHTKKNNNLVACFVHSLVKYF